MDALFRFPDAVERDPAVEAWFRDHDGALGEIAQRWFGALRELGDDVRELMHDDQPTACVGDAAFAYVAVYKAHVNVGFFRGAELPDPHGLLQGTGKYMRHVKRRPVDGVNDAALRDLIRVSYLDMAARK